MAFKLFVFLAILKLVSSAADADPDPNIIIDVNQVVNGGGCCPGDCCPDTVDRYGKLEPCLIAGGECLFLTENCDGDLRTGRMYCESESDGCCIPPGCVFGAKSYPNNAVNGETCLEVKCNKGVWEYTGNIRNDCDTCTASGDPHFWMFDEHCIDGYCYHTYNFYGEDDYVISQDNNILHNALFGVDSHFTRCNRNHETNNVTVTCVQNMTYYELGIKVTLAVHEFTWDRVEYCSTVTDPTTDPKCAIKVFVNDEEQIIGKSMHSFYATSGTVLVFQHNDIDSNSNNINCVNIIGSKSLSVSLCMHNSDYSWIYVFAMPSLKSDPSKLYGLCDTNTGTTRSSYIMSGGSATTNLNSFTDSWRI